MLIGRMTFGPLNDSQNKKIAPFRGIDCQKTWSGDEAPLHAAPHLARRWQGQAE
jgi:hypothetical protein